MKGLSRAVFFGIFVCVACCLVGCAKDTILGFANGVMTSIGDNVLTKGYDLSGRRMFGSDTFVGTYVGNYENKSVREILFGNTALERADGNTIRLRAAVTEKEGTASLMLEQDGKEPEVLLSGPGTIDMEIDVTPGSAYVIFEASDFTGTVDIEAE